jgi:hypothetical protein
MCMACEESELYYRYLDAVEEQKRIMAQPWECEVTLFPAAGDAAPVVVAASTPALAKSGFVCDEAE